MMNTGKSTPPRSINANAPGAQEGNGRSRSGKGVTQARARAQRAKLETQTQRRREEAAEPDRPLSAAGRREGQASDRSQVMLQEAIEDYLADHEGGNHSEKTIEWHGTV